MMKIINPSSTRRGSHKPHPPKKPLSDIDDPGRRRNRKLELLYTKNPEKSILSRKTGDALRDEREKIQNH
jgi:hypothetical protein